MRWGVGRLKGRRHTWLFGRCVKCGCSRWAWLYKNRLWAWMLRVTEGRGDTP